MRKKTLKSVEKKLNKNIEKVDKKIAKNVGKSDQIVVILDPEKQNVVHKG